MQKVFLDVDDPMRLPKNGTLEYTPDFYSSEKATQLFHLLKQEIKWKSEKIKMFGKEVNQPRLIAWYGDPEAVYTYSGLTMRPLLWTDALLKIKERIESSVGQNFNSVLLNYYRSGQDYMGWHADNEKELGKRPVIASLSLGATRRFQLKHRREDLGLLTIELENGSLLIMKDDMQEHWLHKVAATKKEVGERINLTFRKII